jgi:glycosyltransferase involved in cell wall biosynthesis
LHDRLAITWQLTDRSGWGVFGWNLASELLARSRPRPLLLTAPDPTVREERFRAVLAPLATEQAELEAATASRPGAVIGLNDAAVLHHLGNDLSLSPVSRRFEGAVNCGMVFFESAQFSAEALQQAARFDRIIAGCSWNGEVLKARGLRNVSVVLQGIDPSLFHPAPREQSLFPDRFVIFSGGKLEYRKGQDIVLGAFRIFQQRHPEALLLTCWHNLWPQSSESLRFSSHVDGPPEIGSDGLQNMSGWAFDNGIPAESFIDLGFVPNQELPALLRQADVALFPNRCEGGTNLVAMECMACGVPTVLSANTGHLDLLALAKDACIPLVRQDPVRGGAGDTEGWGETSVAEVVEVLERLWSDQRGAIQLGAIGAQRLAELTWRRQVEALLAAMGEV